MSETDVRAETARAGDTTEGRLPRVSVVIPAYNVAPFIEEAVRSALAQTVRDLEVIVVDDGSTDGTTQRLQNLERAVHRPAALVVVYQANGGQNVARNAGIRRCRGTYVAFLDGDDRWHPEKLARQVAMLDNRPDLDLTYCWHRFIDEDGRVTGIGRCGRESTLSLDHLLEWGGIASTSLLVARRDAVRAIGGFDETLKSSADMDFCLRMAMLRPGNIGCLPAVLVDYRRRRGQISASTSHHPADWERLIEKVRAFDPALVARLGQRSRANKRLALANLAYRSGNYAEARALFRQAISASPWTALHQPLHWWRGIEYFLLTALPPRVHRATETAFRRLRTRLRHHRCDQEQLRAE